MSQMPAHSVPTAVGKAEFSKSPSAARIFADYFPMTTQPTSFSSLCMCICEHTGIHTTVDTHTTYTHTPLPLPPPPSPPPHTKIKTLSKGTKEMFQLGNKKQNKTLVCKNEDPSSDPSTHIKTRLSNQVLRKLGGSQSSVTCQPRQVTELQA